MVVWDVSPVIANLGGLELRWYGISWALAFGLGILFFENFFKREKLSPKMNESIFWYVVPLTIIGARLGHCLFYDGGYYLRHPVEILKIWEGGLASHGAALGMLLGLWLFSRRWKMPWVWSLDRIMVPVAVGGAFVRLGNLMNSEIYGRPTGGDWGFEFVRDSQWLENSPQGLPVHPTQLYEAVCYFVVFAVLTWLYYRRDEGSKRPGVMFGVGLVGIFLARFLIEYVKNPQSDFEQGMNLLMGQWLSIPFILLGMAMIVWAYCRKPVATIVAGGKAAQRPGAIVVGKQAAAPKQGAGKGCR